MKSLSTTRKFTYRGAAAPITITIRHLNAFAAAPFLTAYAKARAAARTAAGTRAAVIEGEIREAVERGQAAIDANDEAQVRDADARLRGLSQELADLRAAFVAQLDADAIRAAAQRSITKVETELAIDGEQITTAEQLLDVADGPLLAWLLWALHESCGLGEWGRAPAVEASPAAQAGSAPPRSEQPGA